MIKKIKNVRFSLAIGMVLLMTGSCLRQSEAQINKRNVFMAGAATANITPPLGLDIVGGWRQPDAINIHDELHARCLILDDGATKLVFIVVDNVGLKASLLNEAKKRIQEKTDIPLENILISSTHTHSAVSGGGGRSNNGSDAQFDDYQKLLLIRFVDVASIALNNLEPAKIAWGAVDVPEHLFIRRWKMKPGTPMPNPFGGQDKVVMNPGYSSDLLEPAGKPDPEVSFISVQSTDGRPIALLANYSLHYVGGVPGGDISADYFAVFADQIQKLIGADRQSPPFVGIMSNGTSGDVNNLNYSAPKEKKEPYEQMKYVAMDVANKVFEKYNNLLYQNWVPLKAATDKLTLKARKASKELLKRSKGVILRSDTAEAVHLRELSYARRIIQMEEGPDQIDITLQAFQIGDLGIASIPFEVFAETGMEIKAKSPYKKTFTIELANGGFGYLPTPEQHKLGGYETWYGTNTVEIDASTKIVNKLMELFTIIKQD